MITNPQELSATINELTMSNWTLAAIATLFESKLADALTEPRTIDELATRIEALPRERIVRVLDVVVMRGLVTTNDGALSARTGRTSRDAAADAERVPRRAAHGRVPGAGVRRRCIARCARAGLALHRSEDSPGARGFVGDIRLAASRTCSCRNSVTSGSGLRSRPHVFSMSAPASHRCRS